VTEQAAKKVGWIGAGIMGSSMVRHLLAAGYEVTLHTRTRSKAEPLLELGARWAASPAEAARGAQFVCTNVALPGEIEEVYFGAAGVLSMAVSGQVLIDFGTSKPSMARRIAEAAARKGATSLDAPVTGGDIGARNATLSIMVGGDPEAFARARPLFEKISKTLVFHGPAGSGQRTKIVNQVLVAASTFGMCEALCFAKAAGLDLESVLTSVGGGAGGSWSLNAYAPRVMRGDFEPGFFIEHMVKDLGIARDEARELGLSVPLVELCLSTYQKLVEMGFGRKGTQALFLHHQAATQK